MMNRKGIVLVTMMIIALVLSLVALGMLGLISGKRRLTTHQVDRDKAFYVAEAGIQYALQELRQGKNPDGEIFSDIDLDFDATITVSPLVTGRRTVTSTVGYSE